MQYDNIIAKNVILKKIGPKRMLSMTGVYTIADEGSDARLMYQLEIPEEPQELQDQLNIGKTGDFSLQMKVCQSSSTMLAFPRSRAPLCILHTSLYVSVQDGVVHFPPGDSATLYSRQTGKLSEIGRMTGSLMKTGGSISMPDIVSACYAEPNKIFTAKLGPG